MIRRTHALRRGATAVEAAVVLPVLFTFMFGLIVGGLGVFRYQEVAMLAREGSRWACVHGTNYQSDAGKSSAITNTDVMNATKSLAVALDSTKLTYTLTPNPDLNPGSNATVTVTYKWYPEVYLVGPITLSCSSTRAVSY
jgi:Flp pilus assembly protein TadG